MVAVVLDDRSFMFRATLRTADLQAAIDDPKDHFGATHGLALGQLARRYPELVVEPRNVCVNAEQLSVSKLRRRCTRSTSPPAHPSSAPSSASRPPTRPGGEGSGRYDYSFKNV
jgi:hypothetical protein